MIVFLVAIAIGSAGAGVLPPPSDLPTVPGGGTTVEYIYPMASRLVSDDFERHEDRGSVNPGTDYPSPIGMPVVAVKAGRVILAQHTFGGTGGRMIIIDHGDSSRTEYLHLSRVDVAVHQFVEQGQQIGLSGASGKGRDHDGYGPHLHISLKIDEQNVDFENYVGIVR